MKLLRDTDGTEVKPGDTLTDFRGENWTFVQLTQITRPTNRVKVYAYMNKEGKEWARECYPSVFDCTVFGETDE